MTRKIIQPSHIFHFLIVLLISAYILPACNSSASNAGYEAPPPEALPVITVSALPATTYHEYSASLEGSKDIRFVLK
ncbi:MAG: hypothetical protein WKI04_17965 [Ferruginibacter sp.]